MLTPSIKGLAVAALVATMSPLAPQQVEWHGTVVAESSLEGLAGVAVTIEPLPTGGLFGDMSRLGVSAPSTEPPGADLRPDTSPTPAVRTGADGRFALSAAAGVRLRLSAPGYLDGFVLLHAARDSDLGRLVLRHELSLSGRVVRDDRAAAGVRVLATGYSWRETPPMAAPRQAVTDAQGRFHIGGLYPEQLHELVLIDSSLAVSVNLGSLTLDARHYELGDLELPAVHDVSGRILQPDGSPAVDVDVRVLESDSLRLPARGNENDARFDVPLPSARTDAGGLFEIALPAGEHVLAVLGGSAGNARLAAVVPASTEAVTLDTTTLPGTGVAAGRIAGPDGEPLAGVIIELASVSGWEAVAYEDIGTGDTRLRARTDVNGCYRLAGVPRNTTFWLDATPAGFVPARIRVEDGAPAASSALAARDDCGALGTTVLEVAGGIRGTVHDETGRPVRAAQIISEHHLRPLSAHGGVLTPIETREDGSFDLGPLLPGNYRVIVRSEGHLPTTVRNVAVDIGAVTGLPVTLRDIPNPVTLEVVALDHRGAPWPVAHVSASHQSNDTPVPPLPERFTGADGRVLFRDAASGVYSIAARGGRRAIPWQGPFRIDDQFAVAVVEMAQPVGPLVPLAGRLVDRDGDAIPRARIHARGDRGHLMTTGTTTISEADGSFRFDHVPAGRYLLRADADGLPGAIFADLVDVDPPGVEDLVLTMPPFATVTGSVTGLRDGEAADLSLTARTEVEYGSRIAHSVSVTANVDPDGTFRLGALPPGRWSVAAELGGTRTATVELVVDGSGEPLHVPLALPPPSGFTLRGRVEWRDDAPQTAVVSVRPVGRRGEQSISIGPDGEFEAHDLPAGEYRVGVYNTGMRRAPFTIVDVREDTEIRFVVRSAAIDGHVTDAATGEPIAGAYVSAERLGDVLWTSGGDIGFYTGRNGGFSAGTLPAGRWRFDFRAPGYATHARILEVGDDPLDLRIPLQSTSGLRLRFETPDGSLPDIVTLAWFSLDDGVGYQNSAFPGLRDTMSFHWPDVGLSRGILYASNNDLRLAARMLVDNDGEPVVVPLQGGGRLYVAVPDLPSDIRGATLCLYDENDLPVTNSSGNTEFTARREGVFVTRTLAAGIYRIVVTAPDGRSWSGLAEVLPFRATDIVLR